MTKPVRFLVRLSLRLEAYTFFSIAPLAVYFVVVSGRYRGVDPRVIITGALVGVPVVLGIAIFMRVIRLYPMLVILDADRPEKSRDDLIRIKNNLLNYPFYEAAGVTVRWFVGITIATGYVYYATGRLGWVQYILTLLMVIPGTFSMFYFTTENMLTKLLVQRKMSGINFPPGSLKIFSLFSRTLLILLSVVIIPTIIFGHFFFLSQGHLVHFANVKLHIYFIIALCVFTMLIISYESTVNIRLGMSLTLRTLGEMKNGNLDVQLPVVSRDEIGIIGQQVNFLLESLREYVRENNDLTENLERKVDQRTEDLKKANELLSRARDELWGEMELAKKLHTILLPREPRIEGYELAVRSDPAAQVGGDYYDIINCGAVDWIVIGDVSGHGLPAGLVMMMVQSAIRAFLEDNPTVRPRRLLEMVNRVIRENIRRIDENRFMSLSVMALRLGGEFSFCGLHEDILIFRAGAGTVEVRETDGVWVGMYDDIEGKLFEDAITLGPGDVMLLYTDGILQAWRKDSVRGERTPETDMFGLARLIGILESKGRQHPAQILDEIFNALDGYNREDDTTAVILKRFS